MKKEPERCSNCRFWYGNDGTRHSVHECFTEASYRCPDWKKTIEIKEVRV